jgi:hypothetical protein
MFDADRRSLRSLEGAGALHPGSSGAPGANGHARPSGDTRSHLNTVLPLARCLRAMLMLMLTLIALPAQALDLCQPPRVAPGETIVMQVSGAPPGARVGFVRGTGPGRTCPAGLGGSCFNLSRAVLLGVVPTTADGVATLRAPLPTNLPVGTRFGIQAAIIQPGGRIEATHPFFVTVQDRADLSTACATGNVCADQDADLDGVHDLCDLCADDSSACPAQVTTPPTCSSRAWVGLSRTGDCAELVPPNERADWVARPALLSPTATAEELAFFARLAPELRNLCLLDPGSRGTQPIGKADPDCEIMGGFATPAEVSQELLPWLRGAFLSNSGGPVGAPLSPDAPWVAILDTAAARAPGVAVDPPDQARHGCSMNAFVHDLTCTDPLSCGAQVGTWLALDRDPLAPGGINLTNGGYLGTQSTLAAQILDAVQDWDYAGRPGPLVIHLAVGWEPEYTWRPGSPGTESVGAQAVRLALEYASCEGALVIAAAGNEKGGPVPVSGPMYPAAWGALPPPDCADVGTAREAALLYAVDAVGEDGSLITRARDLATPRLVAWGWQAMADIATWAPSCGIDGAPVTAMTGSSVATAVTVAAAASVWRVDPTLTAAEVMEIVYEGGATPSGPGPAGGWWSAFGPNSPAQVRQVSVCESVNMACAALGWPAGCGAECPEPATCAWDWAPDDVDDIDATGMSLLGPYSCGTSPCAHDTWSSSFSIPWTLSPQPSTDACTECWLNLVGGNNLHLVMNPELPLTRYDAKLILFSAAGTRLGVLDLAALPHGGGVIGDGLAPGELLDVINLPTPPPAATRARLDMRVRWGGSDWSMMSEVPILR